MLLDGLSDETLERFREQMPLGAGGARGDGGHRRLPRLPARSYITGATINVSGGQLMY